MSKESYYEELISVIKAKKPTKQKFSALKTRLCKKHGVKKPATDIEILLNASDKDVPKIKGLLQTKPVRTASGVSVVAIMAKPMKCPHGACRMCSSMTDEGVPQSYTGKEPATRRAMRNKFDPYLQVFNRLEQYIVLGHAFDKVELIIMGGTFPAASKAYKDTYVLLSFKAMNDFSKLFFKKGKFDFPKFKKFFELPGDIYDEGRKKRIHAKLVKLKKKGLGTSGNAARLLEKEQEYNDKKSNVKCVGLTIETRSDYGRWKQGNDLLRLGCTRVELGIQSVYDEALKAIDRGHGVQENVNSIQELKDIGFKLNFHYMPGLPGITPKKDLMGMISLFMDERYQPDMLKIYPCMVVENSKLYKDYKKKKFKPISTKKAAEMIAEFKEYVPEYCRIMRVQRDIPTYATTAGVDMTNLRQLVDKVREEKGIECRCIRCREIGRLKKMPRGKHKIKVEHYHASGGNEFFISAVIKDHILGFCRLRFPYDYLRPEITDSSALIRELHVYGTAVKVGKKSGKGKVQHKGIGKELLAKAEEISKMYYKDKLVVISGVGVRRYYRKLGYKKQGPYMVKSI